jgi:uncharacterized iron-regulated protein
LPSKATEGTPDRVSKETVKAHYQQNIITRQVLVLVRDRIEALEVDNQNLKDLVAEQSDEFRKIVSAQQHTIHRQKQDIAKFKNELARSHCSESSLVFSSYG